MTLPLLSQSGSPAIWFRSIFSREDWMVRQIHTMPFEEYRCLQSGHRTARLALDRDDLTSRHPFPAYALRPLTLSPLQTEYLWSLWGRCVCLLCISLGLAGPERARWLLVFLTLGLVLNSGDGRAQQDLDRESYYSAVEYCRGDVSRPMALSPDQKILCFDGPIAGDLATSFVAGLEENGLFVVRSFDGVGATAIAISNVLRKRRATVVIYDYCLSACASYFFFASIRTYVLKDALVAWHNGGSGFPDCSSLRAPRDEGPKKIRRAPCEDIPLVYRAGYMAFLSARESFYSERTIDSKFEYPPDSFYVRKFLKSMYEERGVYPDVAWTLNPRYLKRTFKADIYYEAYPQSQEEVDSMAARLRLRRVIYDP
jgi:hypothetical protein